jgi:hypothetical protein
MPVLADYRTDLVNYLATAVDSSTWTDAIFDAALRLGLADLNPILVYEDTFTVGTAGYSQTLTITDLYAPLALAYPWEDGLNFADLRVRWRFVPPNVAIFEEVKPGVGEKIRVRYTKQHKIQGLDGAASTTVPDVHRVFLSMMSAAWACDLRYRQVSENPAIPEVARHMLVGTAMQMRQRAGDALSMTAPIGRLRWGTIGLD